MPPERRFQGTMSEGYLLVRQAIPDFHELQRLVAEAVAGSTSHSFTGPHRVLDIGCGDGVTSATILSRCPVLVVTALDSETDMVAQASANLASYVREGRCRVLLHDALAYLKQQPEGTVDTVASALALHNLHDDYRHALHQEIYRVLQPGGLLVNGDKFAESDVQRIQRLQVTVTRFFETLVPLGKLDLLRECVLHEIADDAPERLMRLEETKQELASLGFGDVEVRYRHFMGAVLVARKVEDSSVRPNR
jgi:ubiquinone/menaquinone biosynthesis C-methylase UbiE